MYEINLTEFQAKVAELTKNFGFFEKLQCQMRILSVKMEGIHIVSRWER